MSEERKMRIVKGIKYFRDIKPSKFNAGHVLHLHKFLDLVEQEIFGEKEDLVDVAKKIFNE